MKKQENVSTCWDTVEEKTLRSCFLKAFVQTRIARLMQLEEACSTFRKTFHRAFDFKVTIKRGVSHSRKSVKIDQKNDGHGMLGVPRMHRYCVGVPSFSGKVRLGLFFTFSKNNDEK